MVTNAATLFLDVDSRMVADASKKLQQMGTSADKAGREADRLAAKFDKNYTAAKKLNQEYKDLDAAFNVGYINAQQYADGIQRIDAAMGALKGGASQATGNLHAFDKGLSSSSHHATNLMFQMQDIGMMMAAGQNPFMLMMQQGSQVSGIFSQMQSEGKKIGPALVGAFTQVLNPMTAVTFAVIGGTAALTQWAVSAFSAGADADTLGDALDDMMASLGSTKSAMEAAKASTYELRMEYGAMAGAARQALHDQVQLSQFNLLENVRDVQKNIKGVGVDISDIVAELRGWESGMNDVNRSYAERQQYAELALDTEKAITDAFNLSANEAKSIVDSIVALGGANGLGEAQQRASELVRRFTDAQAAGAKLPPEMARFVGELNEGNIEMMSLINLAGQLGTVLSTITVPSFAGMDFGNPHWWRGQQVEDIMPPIRGFAPPSPGRKKAGGKSDAEKLAEELRNRWEALDKSMKSETALTVYEYGRQVEALKWALQQKKITQEQYDAAEKQLKIESFGTAYEIERMQYQLELQGLNVALEQKYLTQAAYNERVRNLEQEHQDRMKAMQGWSWQENLSGLSSMYAEVAKMNGDGNDKILRNQQKFAAASALINAYEAGSQVLRDPSLPWFAKIGAAGSIIAAGLGMVSAIKGGGSGGSSSASTPATPASKQEPVKNIMVKIDGDEIFGNMAESLIQQIYRQSENGRVIIARGA